MLHRNMVWHALHCDSLPNASLCSEGQTLASRHAIRPAGRGVKMQRPVMRAYTKGTVAQPEGHRGIETHQGILSTAKLSACTRLPSHQLSELVCKVQAQVQVHNVEHSNICRQHHRRVTAGYKCMALLRQVANCLATLAAYARARHLPARQCSQTMHESARAA